MPPITIAGSSSPMLPRLERLSDAEFRLLTRIPLLDRPQVPHHSRINFSFRIAGGAPFPASIKIAMRRTHAEGGRKGKIRKAEIGGNFFDQAFYHIHITHLLAQIDMLYGTSRVLGLQLILKREGLKDIIGIVHRELG